jgi:hypothetical protein
VLYVVAVIGVWSAIAGYAAAREEWVITAASVAVALLAALVLRWYVFRTLEDAYQRGIIYRDVTRRRVHDLPEATTPIKRENEET